MQTQDLGLQLYILMGFEAKKKKKKKKKAQPVALWMELANNWA